MSSTAANEPSVQNAIRPEDTKVTGLHFSAESLAKESSDAAQVDLSYGVAFTAEDDRSFAVRFDVRIAAETHGFDLQLAYFAIFRTDQPITDEFAKSDFVHLNAPAIAFPYVRSFVTTFTVNAGFNPLILPAFNFDKARRQDEDD